MTTSRNLYQRLGFTHSSQWKWFISLALPMLAFVVWQSPDVFVKQSMCNPMHEGTGPGNCYWHTLPWTRYQIGFYIHLWSVLPGTALAVLQFIPIIRLRRPEVHRFIGYICWTLGITSAITALMISDRAFGGSYLTQVSVVILATSCFLGHYKAYIAIKSHRIDKHREWMLRTWIHLGSILTMRPIVPILALGISALRWQGIEFSNTLSCPSLYYMLNNGHEIGNPTTKPDFFSTYGFECSPSLNGMTSSFTSLNTTRMSPIVGFERIMSDAWTTIPANLLSRRIDYRAAALNISFGPAFLIGLAINAFLVEWYIRNTQDEARRLKKRGEYRKLAAQKRLENTGSKDKASEKKDIYLPGMETPRSSVLLMD